MKPYPKYKDSHLNWLDKIPSHWTMTTVRYFYDVKLGKMLDSNKQKEDDVIKPYVRAANIHWNRILLDEVGVNEMGFSESQLERYVLQPGDLLVTEGGVTVGRSAIWKGNLTECYYQNSLNRARAVKDATTTWLYYWMYFVTNNGFIDILADKSTFGHLTNEKLRALPIPIPPLSEQEAITVFLDCKTAQIDTLVEKKQRELELLREMRDVLTQNAMRSSKAKSLKLGEVADWIKRPIKRQDEEQYEPIGLYNRGRGIFHKPITKGIDLGDSDFFEIKEGDLVLSGQFAWEGAVALAQQEEEGCVASHRYYALRGKPSYSETAYLFSLFTTQLGDNLLNYHSRGAAGRNRPLNINTLLREKIPVPPISMQESITALIEKEVVLKKSTQQLVNFLQEYRTALISEAVTGKIDVRK